MSQETRNRDNPEQWWDSEDGDDVHDIIFPHVQTIDENQVKLAELDLYTAKLVWGRELPSLTWNSSDNIEHGPVNIKHESIISGACATATALIAKAKPRAKPVPRDATWGVERQAKKLDRWLVAEFKTQKTYKRLAKAFEDCTWAQYGTVFVGIASGEIYTERVMPGEMVIDQEECQGESEPIQMHRRRLVSRIVLKANYPDMADQIDAANRETQYCSYRTPTSNMVVVIDSWYLALGPNDTGRHTTIIEGATLVNEEYKRKRFPFVFLRWSTMPSGFAGRSLAEEGVPYQVVHNDLVDVIRKSQKLAARLRIFSKTSLSAEDLTNEVGTVYRHKGDAPTAVIWPAVSQELYNERETNWEKFFRVIGMNRMQSEGVLPQGARLDSAKAMREATFQQGDRFSTKSEMYEDAHLEISEHYVELGAELFANKKAPDNFLDRTLEDDIDWKLLTEHGRKYDLEMRASSINNLSTAARADVLERWLDRGLITPEQYKGMSDSPDMDEFKTLWQAARDDIKAVIEELDEEKAPMPDPLQDLTLGLSMVHLTFLARRRTPGITEDILNGYRDWLNEAEAILAGAQQEQQPLPQELPPQQPTNLPPEQVLQ